MCFLHVWCDVNFLYILCLFVLWRVEEPVTEDPGDQHIEVAEQEIIKGKLLSCVCQARYTASLAITTPRTRGLTDPRGRGVGFRLPRAGSHPAPTNLPRSSRDSSTNQTNAPTAGTHDAVTHPTDTYTWALSVSSIYLNYLVL
jgi:hypothetical protein